MPLRLRKLSSQIFAANVGILLVTTTVGFALLGRSERARLDHEFEMRAATIALSVSAMPEIRSCLTVEKPGCAALVQNLATATAARTGASYVVVIDMSRVRHSHPYPQLIGQKVTEPIATLDGRVHTGINDGNTGRSANGKAPLYGTNGAMVGEVSAGIRESSVSAALWQVLPSYATWLLLALGVGAVASWLLARHLKRRTFGLELDEIVKLLQEREATLHGIREGVIAFDGAGRVSLINDEAQRLLRLGAVSGRRIQDLLPPGPLLDALTSPDSPPDEVVDTDDLCLVINRMPVAIGDERHSVVTLRNETEITALASQLTGERSLTESMRAQQHEFANSMHVVAGLLELGQVDDALDYLLEVRGSAAEFDLTLRERIRAPHLIGLLLGKAAEANERGIELIIDPRSDVGEAPQAARALVTIVGNLLDNAFDAVGPQPQPRRVTLLVVESDRGVTVAVGDNGPGIAPDLVGHIFESGVTTKPRERGGGTGLALVRRLVTRLQGTIDVDPGPGARFTVTLPTRRPATIGAGAADA
ncbi:MAG TPA: sensor histidine kinase [Propionibacteriaceae bacterium]|nr:sensor histidine kinase [Propionibacteriaceae bacterium]